MNHANNTIGSGRYRGLIISIALLIAIIGSLLIFTFITSSVIERNTILLNETNKVAISAQEVIKDLFDLENSYGEDINSPHMRRTLERLEQNSQTITESLTAIELGSVVVHSDGSSYNLPTIESENVINDIKRSQEQWSLLRPKIAAYLADADNITIDSSDDLAQAVEQARTSSLLIIDALNDLTDDVFSNSAQQAKQIRLIQIVGVLALFLYFIVFIFFFVYRLRNSDTETLEARRETEEIMQTVSTGLFLLDKNLTIGQQHSKALAEIVGTNKLAGEDFTNILRGRISDKDLTTTKQFIEQLYNPRVKEKLVDDLNPLRKVMLHNDNEGQTLSNRYLDFKFSRVYEGKEISRILVNVVDVSDAVRLEQRLEHERSQNDMQIEMLTTILNVDPAITRDFIKNTKDHIYEVNEVLKSSGSSQADLTTKMNLIYREIHSLKGESSALKLHSFTKIATEAEDKLNGLKNQSKLSGNDFLPLAVDLDELLNLSNTIERLGERINQSSSDALINATASINPAPLNSAPIHASNNLENGASNKSVSDESASDESASDKSVSDDNVTTINSNTPTVTVTTTEAEDKKIESDIEVNEDISLADDSFSVLDAIDNTTVPDNQGLINFYQEFAKDIATRQGKQVILDMSSYNKVEIPEPLKSVTKEITIQSLRNAIVHGIETPETRKKVNKDATGKIILDIKRQVIEDRQMLELVIKDDGGGIDYESVRQRLKDTKKYDDAKIDALTKGQLLNVLFSSGFSTKSDADEDGGRGVGLDIIKQRVKEYNGTLNVKSDSDNMTTFSIALPIE